MVRDVLIDHFLRDIARAPCTITYGPKVPSPVTLLQMRELVLKEAGCSAFESLHDVGDGEFGRILHVHVNVIGAHCTLEYTDVFTVADLYEKLSATLLHVPCEHVVAVFGYPDDVDGHPSERVTAMPVWIWHSGQC